MTQDGDGEIEINEQFQKDAIKVARMLLEKGEMRGRMPKSYKNFGVVISAERPPLGFCVFPPPDDLKEKLGKRYIYAVLVDWNTHPEFIL